MRPLKAPSLAQEFPVEETPQSAPCHRDPFDRLLLAQAVTEPLHLLSTDKVLGSYSSLVAVV